MKKINQKINGNNNIQVAGDLVKTEKILKTTKVIYNPDEYITNAQALEVRNRVQKIAQSLSSTDKYSYSSALLPRDKYDEAIKWLDKQIAMARPKLKNVDVEQFRKDMYKSINARANQLGINIHEFATETLELKKPLTSLKELSDTRLKKLYAKLFNKR